MCEHELFDLIPVYGRVVIGFDGHWSVDVYTDYALVMVGILTEEE